MRMRVTVVMAFVRMSVIVSMAMMGVSERS